MKKSIEICIGTDRAQGVRARLSLLVTDDDGAVISEQYHSAAISPGDDLTALRATLDKHLSTKGGGVPGAPWPAIPDSEWVKVEGVVNVFHTPAVVTAYKAQQAAAFAAEASAQQAAVAGAAKTG